MSETILCAYYVKQALCSKNHIRLREVLSLGATMIELRRTGVSLLIREEEENL